MSSGVAGPEFR
jgi:hypothetical protein